jgi:ribosomal protein S27E
MPDKWRALSSDHPDIAGVVVRCEACGLFKPGADIVYVHVQLRKPKREFWRYRCASCGEE